MKRNKGRASRDGGGLRGPPQVSTVNCVTTEGTTAAGARIVLASSSPRRRELLARAGVRYCVVEPQCEEILPPGIPAELGVQLIARQKAMAVTAPAGGYILAADTLVIGPKGPMGKPRDRDDARGMLSCLSGIRHVVLTGICVVAPDGREALDVSRSTVTMKPLTDEVIATYIASGEPMDKAGGYALQGGASDFVEKVIGRVDTVVGLDIAMAFALLNKVGFPLPLPSVTDIPRELRRPRRPAMAVSRPRPARMTRA